MPTFFLLKNGELQRSLSVRVGVGAGVAVVIAYGAKQDKSVGVRPLTPFMSPAIQFSGADEALLRDNVKQLNDL